MVTTERPSDFDAEEVRAAYSAYVETRAQVMAGDRPWSALSGHFTDDAVFIDPAWGRVEGIDALTRFFDESMKGLDDWTFPEEWTVVDGDRVVSKWWNRLPGCRADGSHYQAAGLSILRYAGDGKFFYEHDLLNMVEVNELIVESGWAPAGEINLPPADPDRDLSGPPGRPDER